MLDKDKINRVLKLLEEAYPEASTALHYTNPFELLIATILSAQCTDKRVNIITEKLFEKYNTPEAFASLSVEELSRWIKSCGFYRNKSQNIIGASQMILQHHKGVVPKHRDELMKLPGVGRKTANVVISNAFGQDAIAVDTHVFRVSNRIGLAHAKNVEDTEQQLMENIPKDQWSRAHHWLIHHGRNICKARKPLCDDCPVQAFCEYFQKQI